MIGSVLKSPLHPLETLAVRLKPAGIEVKMRRHALRHQLCNPMLQNGADIVTIAAFLGHVSLSTTQKYTHIAMVDVNDAYNIAYPRA